MAPESSHYSLPANPFVSAESTRTVFVSSGIGPYDNTISALSNIDLSVAKGKRVLLKPNAGRNEKAGTGINTHPQVVAAAIDSFQAAGAEVSVGESPIAGVKSLEALEISGIAQVARDRNCPLLDMDVGRYIPLAVPDGRAINSLKLCPDLAQFDIVVSIPVMKMHMHTAVTLSVKNMKGCLWRRSKIDLHMLAPIAGCDDKPLNIAIADMASVLRPHLAIIDGTVAMEGLGPAAGTPKKLDAVVVGADGFAADAVACELMGISAMEVPHLRAGAERGYGVIDLDEIKVTPANWRDFISPFVRPPESLSIEFAGFNVMDSQSCSACQSTVLLLLRNNGKEMLEARNDDKDIKIAIGKGHANLDADTLCVGNCTAMHRDLCQYVPGCPPVASEIMKKFLEGTDK
jgi:uncharacterized protein (DUF362 family)